MITKNELDKLFVYCEKTGHLTRKTSVASNKFKAGEIAGTQTARGYIQVKINKKTFYAHRLIWTMKTGKWPKHQIDHKNRVRNDNRWCNLRQATHAQNMVNSTRPNKTGFRGVKKSGSRYRATIHHKGKFLSLGVYDTPEEAYEIYIKKAVEIHGEFAFIEKK